MRDSIQSIHSKRVQIIGHPSNMTFFQSTVLSSCNLSRKVLDYLNVELHDLSHIGAVVVSERGQ